MTSPWENVGSGELCSRASEEQPVKCSRESRAQYAGGHLEWPQEVRATGLRQPLAQHPRSPEQAV